MKKALVIIGASGVGKTTVGNKILADNPEFVLVRSATTRPRRADGNDGEYVYLSEEEFMDRISSGAMLEYTSFSGNYYGTPISELDRIFAEGNIPLLILDLNGAKSLYEGKFDFTPVIIYVYEDIKVIEERLVKREKESPTGKGLAACERRLAENRKDYRTLPEIFHIFDAFIRNTAVDTAADEILKVFHGGKKDIAKNKKIAETLSATV